MTRKQRPMSRYSDRIRYVQSWRSHGCLRCRHVSKGRAPLCLACLLADFWAVVALVARHHVRRVWADDRGQLWVSK